MYFNITDKPQNVIRAHYSQVHRMCVLFVYNSPENCYFLTVQKFKYILFCFISQIWLWWNTSFAQSNFFLHYILHLGLRWLDNLFQNDHDLENKINLLTLMKITQHTLWHSWINQIELKTQLNIQNIWISNRKCQHKSC